MNFNLGIASRLAVAIAIPVVMFTLLAGHNLLLTWRARSEVTELRHMAQGVTRISRFVHHLQRERGASAVLIGSKGAQMRAELTEYRGIADEQRGGALSFLSELGAAVPAGEVKDAVVAAIAAAERIDSKRREVDVLRISGPESVAYYTDTIDKLLTVAGMLSKISNSIETSLAISGYVSFMQGKERAGLERATGGVGIAQGKFDRAGYARMIALRAAQDVYFNAFLNTATPEQRALFQRTMSANATETVAKMRDTIATSGLAGELQGLDTKSWFDAATARIDLLKSVEDRIAADLIASTDAIGDTATRSLLTLTSLIAIAFFVSLILVAWIARGITRPLGALTQSMKELAAGNFGVLLAGIGRKDEVGEMAGAVEQFKVKAAEKAKREADERLRQQKAEAEAEAEAQARVAAERARAAEIQTKIAAEQAQAFRCLAEGLDRLARGDLTFRLTDGFGDDYKQIKDDFNTAIGQLRETIAAIAEATREVSNASSEIAVATTDLSQRTEEQAASLEQTSASMEEISSTVRKNASNAQRANQSAGVTSEIAARGGEVVGRAVDAMARIEESSRKIADIIIVIDEIARQTNLLALNAAVEAARAGDAGRGFAVVAAEVRSLAQRSSQAAKDIKDLITNSTTQVKDGVELVNRAGLSLNEIVSSIKSVADVISEIAAASTEQAGGIDQVNKALEQMDEVTQQNSALVEQNAATAKSLERQSSAMSERVGMFKLDVAAPGAQARKASAMTFTPAAVA